MVNIKNLNFSYRRKLSSRSIGGDIVIFLFLLLFGVFMVLPLIYAVVTAFRELSSFLGDTCAEITDIQSQQVTGALKIRGWGRGRGE